MNQSDAEKAAKARYNAKNYKKMTLQMSFSEYEKIVNYCKENGISQTRFAVRACMYFMNKNELPPE